jgi:hypothetical protein
MGGIPGTVIKLIAEMRTEELLRVLNTVNRSEKISAIWKVAKVVLMPKWGKKYYTPIFISADQCAPSIR